MTPTNFMSKPAGPHGFHSVSYYFRILVPQFFPLTSKTGDGVLKMHADADPAATYGNSPRSMIDGVRRWLAPLLRSRSHQFPHPYPIGGTE